MQTIPENEILSNLEKALEIVSHNTYVISPLTDHKVTPFGIEAPSDVNRGAVHCTIKPLPLGISCQSGPV